MEDLLSEVQVLENDLAATQFAQQCKAEWEEQEQASKTESRVTELIQVGSSVGAGALSLWTTSGGFPVGAVTNMVVGGLAKAGSVYTPDNRSLRIACRSAKTLFHSQISISTRELLKRGQTP